MNWKWLKFFPGLDKRSENLMWPRVGGSLVDLGSSDGHTLQHFHELRPDLVLTAVDVVKRSNFTFCNQFIQSNLEKDRLALEDASVDMITCMQVIEHLESLENLMREAKRVLKPEGRMFLEFPAEKTAALKSYKGRFTFNFYDDSTHIALRSRKDIIDLAQQHGFRVLSSGVSRNYLFAAAWPLLMFMPYSRLKMVSRINWIGWSNYVLLSA